VVHWDGKMLPELTGREKVERIPIIISYSDGEQLLGILKVVASTGDEISRATFNMLTEWGISDKIVAVVVVLIKVHPIPEDLTARQFC